MKLQPCSVLYPRFLSSVHQHIMHIIHAGGVCVNLSVQIVRYAEYNIK